MLFAFCYIMTLLDCSNCTPGIAPLSTHTKTNYYMQILIIVVLHSSRHLLNLQTKHVIFQYETSISEGHMDLYKIMYVFNIYGEYVSRAVPT